MDEKSTFSNSVRANWRESLLAVLLGNVIYFLLVEPQLAAPWHHQPLQIDRGLLLDFAICFVVFFLIRLRRKT